jgi:dihydroorotase
LYLGLPLKDVISMATLNPARCLGLDDEIGTLKPGSIADISILELCSEPIQYEDCGIGTALERVEIDRQLVSRGVIRRGELVFLQD